MEGVIGTNHVRNVDKVILLNWNGKKYVVDPHASQLKYAHHDNCFLSPTPRCLWQKLDIKQQWISPAFFTCMIFLLIQFFRVGSTDQQSRHENAFFDRINHVLQGRC